MTIEVRRKAAQGSAAAKTNSKSVVSNGVGVRVSPGAPNHLGTYRAAIARAALPRKQRSSSLLPLCRSGRALFQCRRNHTVFDGGIRKIPEEVHQVAPRVVHSIEPGNE